MIWLQAGVFSSGLMAARCCSKEGVKANPANFLLMHCDGTQCWGVLGPPVAAGAFYCISWYQLIKNKSGT